MARRPPLLQGKNKCQESARQGALHPRAPEERQVKEINPQWKITGIPQEMSVERVGIRMNRP